MKNLNKVKETLQNIKEKGDLSYLVSRTIAVIGTILTAFFLVKVDPIISYGVFLSLYCALSPLYAWLHKEAFFKMEKAISIVGIVIYMMILFDQVPFSMDPEIILYAWPIFPHLICAIVGITEERADHVITRIRVIDNTEYSYKVWYWDTPHRNGYRGGKIKKFWIAISGIGVWEFNSHEIQRTDDENVQTVLEEMVSKYN